MVNKKIVILIVVIIVAALFAFRHFTESEEGRVRRRLALLSERVEKKGDEAAIKMALRVRRIGELFSRATVIEADLYDLSGDYRPENLSSLAAAISARFNTLALTFYDIRLEFLEERVALATMTATLKGRGKIEGPLDAAHEIEVELVRDEGEWYISRISLLDVLER